MTDNLQTRDAITIKDYPGVADGMVERPRPDPTIPIMVGSLEHELQDLQNRLDSLQDRLEGVSKGQELRSAQPINGLNARIQQLLEQAQRIKQTLGVIETFV